MSVISTQANTPIFLQSRVQTYNLARDGQQFSSDEQSFFFLYVVRGWGRGDDFL